MDVTRADSGVGGEMAIYICMLLNYVGADSWKTEEDISVLMAAG